MSNPNFNPSFSTNDIWRDLDDARCLTDDLDTIESDISDLETDKADINHTHSGYATASDVTTLQTLVGDTAVSTQITNAISGKADTNHTHSEYANQNAFSNVTVGTTTIAADTVTDTLTLAAGDNITLTTDTDNDKITISATDTVYTHPTTSGNRHIPSGGASGQVLRWSTDGTAVWGDDSNAVVDSALSSTSTNPVQNKVINEAINNLSDVYATKSSPQFTNSISMNRETWSTVGTNSTTLGFYCQASGNYSYAEGYGSKATNSESDTITRSTSETLGYCCHAEGYYSIARGAISHAEGNGTLASGRNAHAEGNGTVASGSSSHAEGYTTTASGTQAHAEGISTKASGEYSHAEGYYSEASNYYTHAEGMQTTASGSVAHAEGANTVASGYRAHAEGDHTIAQTIDQHVEGSYNIPDTEGSVSTRGKYLHITGNGSNLGRSNAYTLDWDGNGWFAGTVEGTALILKSSTSGSTKRFKITVNDSGAITATEIT